MSDTQHAPFRWGFIGTGPVSRKFLLGLKPLRGDAVATVVASRDPANAEKFARELGVATAAPDFATAAQSPDVDALYIATPPASHEEHALLGINAGKAVLIEKPFALSGAAARRVAEAARANGVFAMEAMWTRFLPLVTNVRARIEVGEIGAPRAFHGAFYGADIPDTAISVFDPERGGGALMHRGIYPLSLARHLLGPVADFSAMARIGETGVDEDCAVTLRHESGAISTLRASLRANGRNDALIAGTEGTIRIEAPIYRPHSARLFTTRPRVRQGTGKMESLRESTFAQTVNQRFGAALRALRGSGRAINGRYLGNGYHYEAAAVMEAVRAGERESQVMPLDESVEIMDLVDAIRDQWKKA